MSTGDGKLVDALPVAIFLVFAAFWTAFDLKHGLWLAVLPSALVGLTLLAKKLLGKRP